MVTEDYNKEIFEDNGYTVELSNQGNMQKRNPNFFNPQGNIVKCKYELCLKNTVSKFCLCSKHNKLKHYPFHTKDWVGIVIVPGKTREECKNWALPHGTIAELLIRWIDSDEEKGKKIDVFVEEIIEKIHKKIPNATLFQEVYMNSKNYSGIMTPDDFVKITKDLVEYHFPSNEYENVLIDGKNLNFKKIQIGWIPLRVVLASLVLALGCEESNRGDALGALQNGFEPRYANIFMPLGGYLLRRKGATNNESKMSMRG